MWEPGDSGRAKNLSFGTINIRRASFAPSSFCPCLFAGSFNLLPSSRFEGYVVTSWCQTLFFFPSSSAFYLTRKTLLRRGRRGRTSNKCWVRKKKSADRRSCQSSRANKQDPSSSSSKNVLSHQSKSILKSPESRDERNFFCFRLKLNSLTRVLSRFLQKHFFFFALRERETFRQSFFFRISIETSSQGQTNIPLSPLLTVPKLSRLQIQLKDLVQNPFKIIDICINEYMYNTFFLHFVGGLARPTGKAEEATVTSRGNLPSRIWQP